MRLSDWVQDNEPALGREVGELVDTGYTRVKVKICPGADVGVLRTLRTTFPRLGIQADTTAPTSLRDPSHLSALLALDALDLLCIEQPLDPDDLCGHVELTRRLSTPVCLDESIWSLSRLEEAIAAEACDMVCIKPSRLGGLLPAVAAHDLCVEAGIGAWCGGMLETSLAAICEHHLGGPPRVRPPGGSERGRTFHRTGSLPSGRRSRGSRGRAVPIVEVHSGPGVGPAPDLSALKKVTRRRHWAPV